MRHHVSGTTLDLSPQAQVRAAAEYIRRRYAGPWAAFAGASWRDLEHEEESMSETTISAPRNPYRMNAEARGTMVHEQLAGFAGRPVASPATAQHDTARGPGLSAGDLDRMCRDHFQLGFRTRDREANRELDEMRAQLADAFDEGYTAGRVERAQGLARDVFSRLAEPQVALIEARSLPRAKTREALDDIESGLRGVQEFVAGLFTPHDTFGAVARAAAQAARDEA